jgi:Zn-dependent M28 family amino/carboxypeptidase
VSLAAALLAAVAAAGSVVAPPEPSPSAHDLAVRIAGWGPRPAAGAAEARAQRLVARSFRSAGLRVAVQEFRVPGRGGSRNVIGALQTPAPCLHVVMAHADSTPNAPGANDNASGLAVVAALAGRLTRAEPRCDVWLVATGAEERIYTGAADHLGALALARRVRARGGRDRLRFALSLDEVGRDRPFWLRSPVAAPRPRVEGAIARAASRVAVPLAWVRDEGTGNSDHREFELLGLPGAKLGVGAGGEPCRHSPCDRAERLDPRSLRLARRLVESVLRGR